MPERSAIQRNRLLSALSSDVMHRLFPHLELVPLPLGKVLHESGENLNYTYFPTDAIVSQLYETESGSSAEVASVGCDGMEGVSLLMGGEIAMYRTIVLNAGYAYRIPGRRLKEEFNRSDELQRLMLRYVQVYISQIAQMAVCNRFHSIDQRLCRLLLHSLDRLQSNQLGMTQELIASALGVRREGVTEAAGKLQKLGVIKYSRGHIAVLDRPTLEKLSCECYAVIKKETDRLLPASLAEYKVIEMPTRGSFVSSAR